MKNLLSGKKEGFTLLEVIITLIIASIMGSMLITMTGGAVTRSTQPVIQTAEINTMNSVADSVARAYRELGSTSDLQTEIGNGTFNAAGITVTANLTGYGTGSSPSEGASNEFLKVTVTGSTGLSYDLIFGDIEI